MESELKSVVGESPKITPIATAYGAACGPVFSRRGYLLFCDRDASKIFKWEEGAVSVFRQDSHQARALTFDHQGRLLACEKDRVTRTEKDGQITVLVGARQSPSDLIYAIDGNIYFTDDAVYQIKRDGKVVVASRDCRQPVGLALAPNQQKLYVADAAGRKVWVFEITPTGALASGAELVTTAVAGGLKTDEDGRIWVAAPEGIVVFSREGKALGTIALPEPPDDLNWGPGFRDVVATARTSVYRVAARTNGTRTF
jgi:gluconolactonase